MHSLFSEVKRSPQVSYGYRQISVKRQKVTGVRVLKNVGTYYLILSIVSKRKYH